MENILREEPDYPEGLSILAMIDAALGKTKRLWTKAGVRSN